MNRNKKLYMTIGEAAKEISVKTPTLRFWEKEFKQIKPKILFGQRRYYTKKDMDVLKIIYELVKKQGYTIKGAKKLLNNSTANLDVDLNSSVNSKKFQSSLKIKAEKIKLILKRIKGDK